MIGDIIIANVLASAGLVLLIYFFDYNEKEPVWTLVRIYVLSILATFLFGKAKGLLFQHFGWNPTFWVNAFVVAGFCEELLKLGLVLILVWPLKTFDEENDGIIYFLFVAAGFTVLENLGYSFNFVMDPYLKSVARGEFRSYSDALQQIVLLRTFSGHIFMNVVSGFFLGLAKLSKRRGYIAAGFAVTVLLHGFWNVSAYQGWLGWYVLGFLVLDIALMVWSIRRSFYFKFMKRLAERIGGLIREAQEAKLSDDLVTLMKGILRNVRCLRSLEGGELKNQAKDIIMALPSRIRAVPIHGRGGLTERLIKLNGILSRDRTKTGWKFWSGFFLKFFIPGFLVLTVLMHLT